MPYKFLVLVLLLCLSSCENSQSPGQLIVGTSSDNPPYEFLQDGQIIGLDIEVIKAIGQYLGKEIVIKNLDFSGLLATLASNNVDLVIAGLSVTPQRLKRVDFSVAYAASRVAMLYRTEGNIGSLASFQNKNIGAQLGSVWSLIAADLAKSWHFNLSNLSSNLMLVEELKLRTLDGVILEEAQCQKFIARNPNLSYFLLTGYQSNLAIAVKKGAGLRADIDDALRALQADGRLQVITEKWLGRP